MTTNATPGLRLKSEQLRAAAKNGMTAEVRKSLTFAFGKARYQQGILHGAICGFVTGVVLTGVIVAIVARWMAH